MEFISKQKAAYWIIGLLVVLNLIVITLLWISIESPHRPFQPMPRSHDRHMLNKLDFTEEQQVQFKQYRREYFQMVSKYTGQINTKKHDILEMLFQPQPDRQRMDSLADDIGVLVVAFEKARFQKILKFKTFLTDNQFQTFKQIVDEAYKPEPGEMRGEGPPQEHGPMPPGTMPPPPGKDRERFHPPPDEKN